MILLLSLSLNEGIWELRKATTNPEKLMHIGVYMKKIEKYNLVVLVTLKELQMATQCFSSACLHFVVLVSVH
jgi:hypothetical protein